MDHLNETINKINDLLKSKNTLQAKLEIEELLEKFPNQIKVLIIANKVFRQSGEHEKSLEYAKKIIIHYPKKSVGYKRAAIDLNSLKRFEEAKEVCQVGLENCPNQIELLKLFRYIKSFLGNKTRDISELEKNNLSFDMRDLIAYSSVPNFFKIIKANEKVLTKDIKKIKNGKSFLFIAGLGRSGTTALGNLLNKIQLFEIYTELHPWNKIGGYSPADFLEESIQKKITTSKKFQINKKILSRHPNSKIIGDKRPGFQYIAESTFDNFEDKEVKCIYIDRSLIDICRSSHKRSQDKKDPWSIERGIEHTILSYNASCRQIIHLYNHRPEIFSQFMFPKYENVFSSIEAALDVIKFSEIDYSQDELSKLQSYIITSKKYTTRYVEPGDSLDIYIRESICKLLDYEIHDEFCSITCNHRKYELR